MNDKHYIEANALEKAGWYLCRQIRNQKNLPALETKPLRAVPEASLNLETAGAKVFSFPPTFRDQDANGKPICRRCGKRLGAARTPFCPGCGGQFVEETATTCHPERSEAKSKDLGSVTADE